MGVLLSYILTFITNLIIMLAITLVIAALTLIERKFLALNQRRVGPYYVGYRGRLQYIADALKLFIKGVVTCDEANKFWFYAVPSFAGLICYFFWINSTWCPSVSIFDIEYNLVYASLLSVSFSFSVILLGYFSGNKYTKLASIRAALSMLNLELFLGLMILSCVTLVESFCFSVFVVYQEYYWFIITYFSMCGILCIIFLMEVGRTPFDLAEAESELVVGYSTEIGGFTFGIYYLGEYFHLFFFSGVIAILFFGGWEFSFFFDFDVLEYFWDFIWNLYRIYEEFMLRIIDIIEEWVDYILYWVDVFIELIEIFAIGLLEYLDNFFDNGPVHLHTVFNDEFCDEYMSDMSLDAQEVLIWILITMLEITQMLNELHLYIYELCYPSSEIIDYILIILDYMDKIIEM